MITEDGALKIIDFGIAGTLQTNLDADKRKTFVGTLHWMPPEMHRRDAVGGTASAYGYEVSQLKKCQHMSL
jgi:serine/threonine protein kinase